MTSLEGWGSTIELRPQQPPRPNAAADTGSVPSPASRRGSPGRCHRPLRRDHPPGRLQTVTGLIAALGGIVIVTGHGSNGEGETQHMAQASAQIGVTGLGVMGRNLARNFARHGYTVALHNRTASRATDMVSQFGDEGTFVPAQSAQEFVAGA